MSESTTKAFIGVGVVAVVCSALTAGVVLSSGILAPTADEPEEPSINSETLYEEHVDSVVTVYVVGESGSSSGSGFVYDKEGHLLTNEHVIDDAETVQIKFGSRGEWRRASIVGKDARTDLAVLRVDGLPSGAEPLTLASQPPKQGSDVVAIGSPLRLEGTITTGTVSGVDRALRLPSGTRVPDTIQTDAAINPGNSGGPLLNDSGAVVGVNTARADADNIGFVVSAATVDRVVPSLIDNGSYNHPYLGVDTRTVVPAIATANNLTEISGAAIVEIDSEGPAADRLESYTRVETVDGQRVPAGGDVIVSVDGTRIEDDHDLLRYIALETEPGKTVSISVVRDGERQTVDVTLGDRPR